MLLDNLHGPEDLKKLTLLQLDDLAQEIRKFLIERVQETGGHLSSNLGVVELTLALHKVFNFKEDRLLFDVSHQSYTHKILTGRKSGFDTLRQFGGLSGFTSPMESDYDVFKMGHAGTSISLGMGLKTGFETLEKAGHVVIVIGDASIGNGMAFEALNHLGFLRKDLIIVLNDNQMSISKTIGAFSKYLSRFVSGTLYNALKRDVEKITTDIPVFGSSIHQTLKNIKNVFKKSILSNLFEKLNLNYVGPVNGHDLDEMQKIFENVKTSMHGPTIVHAITIKGKGFRQAELNPTGYHGVSAKKAGAKEETFTEVFGKKMLELASRDKKVVVITAAMTDGTGLNDFSERFPERYYDVGIAEGHAVGFAAGLSAAGLKPYVAIYSTFMQRALDQFFQEVSLQNDVNPVFVMDRSGLVGEDGATHHGVFDIAYTRFLPRFVLLSPKDGRELSAMLEWVKELRAPVVIRFSKGGFHGFSECAPLELGKSEWLSRVENPDFYLLSYGSMTGMAVEMMDFLPGKKAQIINLRFAKPLDAETLLQVGGTGKPVICLEEHALLGGVGEGIAAFFADHGLDSPILRLGLEDHYYTHGARDALLDYAGLSPRKLAVRVEEFLK